MADWLCTTLGKGRVSRFDSGPGLRGRSVEAGRPFHLSASAPAESIRFSNENVKQWNSIVNPLFHVMADTGESPQFSISLPSEALEMIEEGLIPFGLYGKKRASVCRALILDMLKLPAVQEQIRAGRTKVTRN